jgi:uncharacterized membrane protein YdbT with pleckstrin-like domain
MSYLRRILSHNEVLIVRARFPWFYYAAAWGALLVALWAAAALLNDQRSQWLALGIAAAGLVIFLKIMIWIWTTEIGLTNRRVIVKRGFPARHTREMELSAIEEIELDQSVLGRLLGFGRIDVEGTGDDHVKVPAIAHPLAFLRAVESAVGDKGPLARRKRV